MILWHRSTYHDDICLLILYSWYYKYNGKQEKSEIIYGHVNIIIIITADVYRPTNIINIVTFILVGYSL